MRDGFKTISFRGNAEQWEKFKLLSKYIDSDASKELRKYIADCIECHEEEMEYINKRLENDKKK